MAIINTYSACDKEGSKYTGTIKLVSVTSSDDKPDSIATYYVNKISQLVKLQIQLSNAQNQLTKAAAALEQTIPNTDLATRNENIVSGWQDAVDDKTSQISQINSIGD